MSEKFKAQPASPEERTRKGLGTPEYFGRFISALGLGFPEPPSFADRIGIDPKDLELITSGRAVIPGRSVLEEWQRKLELPGDDADCLFMSAGYPLNVDQGVSLNPTDQPLTVQAGVQRAIVEESLRRGETRIGFVRRLIK